MPDTCSHRKAGGAVIVRLEGPPLDWVRYDGLAKLGSWLGPCVSWY